MKLYLVESALRAFLNELEEGDGSLTPEQEVHLQELCGGAEKLIEFLAVMEAEANAKGNVYRAMADQAKEEVADIVNQGKRHHVRADKASARILNLMLQLGIKEYNSAMFRIVQVNHPRKVITPTFFNVNDLPEEFVRTSKELDKGAMILASTGGKELPANFSVVSEKGLRITKR